MLGLLRNPNRSLFPMYVNKGNKVPDTVLKEVVKGRHIHAFKIIAVCYHRRFKELAKRMTFAEIIRQKPADIMFSEEIQLLVLDSGEQLMWQIMLCNMPLWPNVQKELHERQFEFDWFKMHVVHLYGMAGYRFEPQTEELMLAKLGCKNIDDCMRQFGQQNDASFVSVVSAMTAAQFCNEHWLSDDAQVSVIWRRDQVINVLIRRFTPEHGMCWRAEVEMAKICPAVTIKMYIEFHSMCSEALNVLKMRFPELHYFYYTRHAY